MAEAKAEEKPAKPKANVGAILKYVGVAVNVIVVFGGAALTYMSTLGYHAPVVTESDVLAQLQKEKSEQKARDIATAQKTGVQLLEKGPVMYTLDRFTVNLEGVPNRIVQADLSLEMLDEQGFEEIVTLGPEARDEIVRILSAKRFVDVETIQGKLHLKDQIRTTLNRFLEKGVVKDVYLSHFVVQ
ncbi:MAG: flagellar basal body-associated FliL family protein [Bdellovibrionales bacterium]|nr:flagellar basal body-associated FliL family protein [Bdellovibrionales bacterium]